MKPNNGIKESNLYSDMETEFKIDACMYYENHIIKIISIFVILYSTTSRKIGMQHSHFLRSQQTFWRKNNWQKPGRRNLMVDLFVLHLQNLYRII